MAANNLSIAFSIFSLLFFSTFSTACIPCTQKPPPPPPSPPPPKPVPPPKAPPVNPFCPRDTLKFGVCSDLLGLVGVIGSPPSSKCCALLEGLADSEAAVCLCTAIKANVLGMNLNVPIVLSILFSACEKTIPPGYKCE